MERSAAAETPGEAVDFEKVDADPSEDCQNNECRGTESTQDHQDAALRGTHSTEYCQDGTFEDASAAGDSLGSALRGGNSSGDAHDDTLGDVNSAVDSQDSVPRDDNSAGDSQDGAPRDDNSAGDGQDSAPRDDNSAGDGHDSALIDTNFAGDGHDGTLGDANSAEECQNGRFSDASPNEDCPDGAYQGTDTRKDCQGDELPAECQNQGEEDFSGGDLFFIDKKGGETAEQPPLYTADFISLEEEEANVPEPEGQPQRSFECFNCGGGHLLCDCPKEIDAARVSRKRKEMARERDAGPKKMRYFEYEMSRRFQPGKLSEELRDAMDLKPDELPEFIYRMRILGYPPGWLMDAEIEESGLEIYGLDDKNYEDGEVGEVQYDPTRLISYPGFNVPVPRGVIDRWEEYEMPPMISYQQRSEAEKYMKAQAAKSLDQRKKVPMPTVQPSPDVTQVVDMNIEDDEIEEGQICFESSAENSGEADKGSAGSTPGPDCVCNTLRMPSETASTSSHAEGSALKLPVPDSVENGDTTNTEEPASELPKVKPHKVTLGTPILLGFSEYSSLPPRENFAKGVSEFIPFENLPGTTGRYSKLRQVLDKVRAMRQVDKKQDNDQ